MQHKILEEFLSLEKKSSICDADLNLLVKDLIGYEIIDPNLALKSQ
jgi:hypothetical protein